MAERNSEYARMDGDTYVTPKWVYEALYAVEPWAIGAWFVWDWAYQGKPFLGYLPKVGAA